MHLGEDVRQLPFWKNVLVVCCEEGKERKGKELYLSV